MTNIVEFPGSANERAATMIQGVSSVESLKNVLDELGRIKGSDGYVYSADELMESIKKVMDGKSPLQTITRTHGLRDKVQELLMKESGSPEGHKETKFSVDINAAKENKTVSTLLGMLFSDANVNMVRREGVGGRFTQEQLDHFLKKYPDKDSFDTFLKAFRFSQVRQLEIETDSIEKAHIRDGVLKAIDRIMQDPIAVDEAKVVLYGD